MPFTGVGVQVPPPTRREPLFDSGSRRVRGLVGRDLEGNRAWIAPNGPSSLRGERQIAPHLGSYSDVFFERIADGLRYDASTLV